MDHFSKSGTVRARFEEIRRISLLTDPIESEGIVYFSPPDRLARYTTRPGNMRIVIRGNRVVFEDETGMRMMDLGSSDIAQGLIDNLMVLLRGDLTALRERYMIAFDLAGEVWQLDLEPRSEVIGAIVEKVRFSGTGWLLQSMETHEANGDTSLVAFSDVETRLTLSEAERERIFYLGTLGKDGSFTPPVVGPSWPTGPPSDR